MRKLLLILATMNLVLLSSCDEDSPVLGGGGIVENLKTKDSTRIQDVQISANYVSCYITPSGFEYDKLIKKGYSHMNITFEYYVSYHKTWDSLDFLYNGAPKYDVTIKDSNNMGVEKEGLKTTKNSTYQSINASWDLADLKFIQLILEIGSTNIQNDIYFTDLKVSYQCV